MPPDPNRTPPLSDPDLRALAETADLAAANGRHAHPGVVADLARELLEVRARLRIAEVPDGPTVKGWRPDLDAAGHASRDIDSALKSMAFSAPEHLRRHAQRVCDAVQDLSLALGCVPPLASEVSRLRALLAQSRTWIIALRGGEQLDDIEDERDVRRLCREIREAIAPNAVDDTALAAGSEETDQ